MIPNLRMMTRQSHKGHRRHGPHHPRQRLHRKTDNSNGDEPMDSSAEEDTAKKEKDKEMEESPTGADDVKDDENSESTEDVDQSENASVEETDKLFTESAADECSNGESSACKRTIEEVGENDEEVEGQGGLTEEEGEVGELRRISGF